MLIAGLRVLIVEDEPIVAMLLEEYLLDAGCEIAATAATLRKALELARTVEYDVAVLDVSLGAYSSYAVADVLVERKIPFLFASGFGSQSLPPEHRGRTVLGKPFLFSELVEGLQEVLGAKLSSK